VDIMGLSFATNTVTVNGQTAYRKGEYFRRELAVDNSSSARWTNITVAATNQTNVTGNAFLPKTQEHFTYDNDGNLTSDGRWNYAWDAENRLVNVTNNTSFGPQQGLKFDYDGRGRRIHKQVRSQGSAPTNDVKFVYDGWNLLAELNATNNAVIRSFLWGSDLSGTMQGAGGVGGLLEVSYNGTQTTNCFVAFDGNGNVAALADAASTNILAQYEYGPFGEVLRATGPMAKANPFRFSTKYQDDETDLLYYGYRYYSASTGRWLSRDPIEESGGRTLYCYANGDGINHIDPLGLLCWTDPVSGVPICDSSPTPTGDIFMPYPKYNPPDLNKPCCCMDHSTISSRRTDRPPTQNWSFFPFTSWTLHLSVDVKVTGNCIKDVEIQWQRCYNRGVGGYMGSGPAVDVGADTITGIRNAWLINARVFYLKCEYGYWRLGRKALNRSADASMGWVWNASGWEN